MPIDPLPIAATDIPSAFACPYRKACWQREIIRIIVTIAVALVAAGSLKGCTIGQGGTLSDFKATSNFGTLSWKTWQVEPAPSPATQPVPVGR